MKIIFVPVKEEMDPSNHTIFVANFRLGFFGFSLYLIDTKGSIDPHLIEAARILDRALGKRYLCILQIGNSTWIWYTSDNEYQTKTEYQKVLRQLKYGENVIFNDLGESKIRSIRLSWRAVEIEW